MTSRSASTVDIALLAAFRVLFGLLMCAGIVRFMSSGWIEVLYVEPELHFKYWGFSWVEAWPRWGMYLHYSALAVLALSIALGLFYRIAAPLFFLGFSYAQLIDVTNYLNHYYLVALLSLLIAVLPLHRAWSLDAWRKPALRADRLPAWMLHLLRFQIAVVYVYAGLAKLGSDWLLHAQPLAIWLHARSELPIVGPIFALPLSPLLMSWAGFLFDTTIVLWLSWKRTRPFAYAAVLLFHGLTFLLFDIGLFPFIMTIGALLFFPPELPRRLLSRVPGLRARIARASSPPPVSPPRTSRGDVRSLAGAMLGLGYCALQLLLPLRALAYPGDVLWNEQGMRWSWRVMVREKHGAVTYHVRDPRDGRRFQVTPSQYLTPRQEGEMSSQPDLILQLAHHIARDFARRGRQEVEVFAETWVSLNGRPAAPLIDPSVNLARVDDGVTPARWILKAPAKPPIELHHGRAATRPPRTEHHAELRLVQTHR